MTQACYNTEHPTINIMRESDHSLYITNAWKGLVTETARKYFENLGWTVDGNWLNGKNLSPLYKVILAAPAFFDGALIAYPKDLPSSRIFAHLLYPDEMVGWNFETNSYRRKKQEAFIPLLENAPILSHSQFTLELASSVYGDLLNPNRSVTLLPIEFNNIRRVKQESVNEARVPTRVLWNHMWRSDKGIKEALTIIEDLSMHYPDVEFFLAREKSWGGNPDVNHVKGQTKEIVQKLRARNNVRFQQNFGPDKVIDYWRFLAQFDIGFSVSHQEGFGLSMLEQASAGIACVMPIRESYPEIHTGGLITGNVAEGISELIENPQRRKEISQKGMENASRFNAEDWVKRILEKIA